MERALTNNIIMLTVNFHNQVLLKIEGNVGLNKNHVFNGHNMCVEDV